MNVLVVDDSAVVRQAFTMLLGRQFDVETAADPIIAEQKIRKRRPDVIVLDLQMPRMDGLTFLRRVMERDPLPVVICSASAAQGSGPAMRALEEGAVDVILKPSVGVREFLEESALLLADTIRAAASARVAKRMAVTPRLSADVVLRPAASSMPSSMAAAAAGLPRIVAVGASTGGTEALRILIERLPANAPAMLVVQHMPAGFTAAFAKRLDSVAAVEVKEAADGDLVTAGRVLISPGDQHMVLRRASTHYRVQLLDGPLVSRHRPSVDVLFRSVAMAAGAKATGVLLTGMGDDGAAGLAEMHDAGARTIAQDEATCVVFGMPKEAIARGAVDQVLPLESIAAALLATGRL
jgi:two-component system chemotaxis response regulator CheB